MDFPNQPQGSNPPPGQAQNQAQGPGQGQGQSSLGRGALQMPQQQQQQAPQLPPQMFTTAAQLLDLTDKKLLVVLRDGRKLIGVLRSWDQFANLVLQNTVERLFAPFEASSQSTSTQSQSQTQSQSASSQKQGGGEITGGLYADVPLGVFIVRGENVLVMGEIDLDKDDDPPPGYEPADVEKVQKLVEEKKEREKGKEKAQLKKLATLGFEGESHGEILL